MANENNRYVVSCAFGEGTVEVTPPKALEEDRMVLKAEEAAQEVFEKLINEVTGGLKFVTDIGRIYNERGYEPSYTGNALLSYGRLSERWVEPDDLNTHRALRRGLRAFGIELSTDEGQPEIAFVDALGKLIQLHVGKSENGGESDAGQ